MEGFIIGSTPPRTRGTKYVVAIASRKQNNKQAEFKEIRDTARTMVWKTEHDLFGRITDSHMEMMAQYLAT